MTGQLHGDFTKEIKEIVKLNIYDMILDKTSIVTPLTRIISELTLMDAMESNFDYQVTTTRGVLKSL